MSTEPTKSASRRRARNVLTGSARSQLARCRDCVVGLDRAGRKGDTLASKAAQELEALIVRYGA